MTLEFAEVVIPGGEMNTADRMHWALRKSGVKSTEMADYIGVSRSAVTQWTNGSVLPRIGTLRLWAMKTGFPLEWLSERLEDELVTERVRRQGLEPRTRWLKRPPATDLASLHNLGKMPVSHKVAA